MAPGLVSVLLALAADPSPPRPKPEPGPAALTTPEASRAAEPAWHRTGFSAARGQWAPQVGDDEGLFDDAPRDGPDGALAQSLLACRIDTFVNEDTTGANDLKVTVRLGKLPPLTVWGPEDQMWMYLSVPLVSLSAGEAIAFDIVDRDVTTDERIDNLTGKFDGHVPLHLESKRAAVTCRALPRVQVDAEADGAMVVVDQALAQHPKLDPKEADWGLGPSLTAARSGLVELAARVGWADPRTQRRLIAHAEQESRALAAIRAVFTREQAMLPAPGATVTVFGQLSVTVKGLTCGDAALAGVRGGFYADEHREVLKRGRCVATVALENLTAKELWLTDHSMGDELGMPVFLAAYPLQGESFALASTRNGKTEEENRDQLVLPPHEVVTVQLAPRYGGVFGSEVVDVDPELLQFMLGEKVARVRLK